MVNHAAGEVIGSNKLTHRLSTSPHIYIYRKLSGEAIRKEKDGETYVVFTKFCSKINSQRRSRPGDF
jgi:hypothetical protein